MLSFLGCRQKLVAYWDENAFPRARVLTVGLWIPQGLGNYVWRAHKKARKQTLRKPTWLSASSNSLERCSPSGIFQTKQVKATAVESWLEMQHFLRSSFTLWLIFHLSKGWSVKSMSQSMFFNEESRNIFGCLTNSERYLLMGREEIFFLAEYLKFLNPALAKPLHFILINYKGWIQAS